MNDEVTGSLAHAPPRVTSYNLDPLGAEPEFCEEARMARESVHRFAVEVMRPVVEAALAAGGHDFDTTGETDWMFPPKRKYGAAFAR